MQPVFALTTPWSTLHKAATLTDTFGKVYPFWHYSRYPAIHRSPCVISHRGEGRGGEGDWALLGFTPFWCAVTGDKGDCALLDRSLVTLMAQGSLIETIGVKRTLEITNIRSQLSCWYADRQTQKRKNGKKAEKGREKERQIAPYLMWWALTRPDKTLQNLKSFILVGI